MEDQNIVKQSRFTGLHRKVRKKYEEMQLKIERSRSTEVLSPDDDLTTERRFVVERETMCYSLRDVRRCGETMGYSLEDVRMGERGPQEEEATLEEEDEFTAALRELLPVEEGSLSSASLESLSIEPESLTSPAASEAHRRRRSLREVLATKWGARRERKAREKVEAEERKAERGRSLTLQTASAAEKAKVCPGEGGSGGGKPTRCGALTAGVARVRHLHKLTGTERHAVVCRLRVGAEKHKSRCVRVTTAGEELHVQEQFTFALHEDAATLDVTLTDRDQLVGKGTVNLSELEWERTYQTWLRLEPPPAPERYGDSLTTLPSLPSPDDVGVVPELLLLLTRTGTGQDCDHLARGKWYAGETGVGALSVRVIGAAGLGAGEVYAALRLHNETRLTSTVRGTPGHLWGNLFYFTVKDVTSILEVTIHEDKKSSVIGKVSIPLLRIDNGKPKWYALKDAHQKERAKGNNPRVLIEATMTWNVLKACVRIVNTKEPEYLTPEQQIDLQTLASHVQRLRAIVNWLYDVGKLLKMCFEWENGRLNLFSLCVWMLGCCCLRTSHLPLLLLLPLLRYHPRCPRLLFLDGDAAKKPDEEQTQLELKQEKEEKQSLRQKLVALQETIQSVQNALGDLASLAESVKNLYRWACPQLSWLWAALLVSAALLLSVVPLHLLLMAWGINKYTRKILRPHREPNNEILDLLSRVPDDDVLVRHITPFPPMHY